MVDNLHATDRAGAPVASARERIIVALDVSTEREALELAEQLSGEVGLFKVGLELFCSVGPRIVTELRSRECEVFLDGKFMDIPATVEGAARAATRLGVRIFNVHCLGGTSMMRAAVTASHQASDSIGKPHPIIIGVTILTS